MVLQGSAEKKGEQRTEQACLHVTKSHHQSPAGTQHCSALRDQVSAGSGGCGGLSGLSVSPLCNWGEGADLINRPYPEGRSNTFADGSRRLTVQLVSARLSSGTHDAVGRENKRKRAGHQRSRRQKKGEPKGKLLCCQTANRAHYICLKLHEYDLTPSTNPSLRTGPSL